MFYFFPDLGLSNGTLGLALYLETSASKRVPKIGDVLTRHLPQNGRQMRLLKSSKGQSALQDSKNNSMTPDTENPMKKVLLQVCLGPSATTHPATLKIPCILKTPY